MNNLKPGSRVRFKDGRFTRYTQQHGIKWARYWRGTIWIESISNSTVMIKDAPDGARITGPIFVDDLEELPNNSWMLQYKCRRCDRLLYLDGGTDTHVWGILKLGDASYIRCKCSDGGFGLADLIGAEECKHG
jgi:hypothetical protein